jgi:hypothetical protein
MHDKEFRYVDKLVAAGNFAKAFEKCWYKWNTYGKFNWAQKLCEVLELSGAIDESKRFREKLATLNITDDQFFENLDKMERLYTLQEWKCVEEKLIQDMRGRGYTPSNCSERYHRFLARKGAVDEIYNICLAQPQLIDKYFELLRPRYEKELSNLFERHVLRVASRSTLSKYKETCELFKKYSKLGVDISSPLAKVRKWHRNRPTLMEMLDDLRLD